MVRKYNAFKDIESCTDCCALKIKIQNLESKIKILREALERIKAHNESGLDTYCDFDTADTALEKTKQE